MVSASFQLTNEIPLISKQRINYCAPSVLVITDSSSCGCAPSVLDRSIAYFNIAVLNLCSTARPHALTHPEVRKWGSVGPWFSKNGAHITKYRFNDICYDAVKSKIKRGSMTS